MNRAMNRVTKGVLEVMSVSDGVDRKTATKYARAAVEAMLSLDMEMIKAAAEAVAKDGPDAERAVRVWHLLVKEFLK